ncbi:hypothetical protein MMC16_005297 [Acarospora aff. strigata]|nr:hypothetical protein [Acarospora aff. strigata]
MSAVSSGDIGQQPLRASSLDASDPFGDLHRVSDHSRRSSDASNHRPARGQVTPSSPERPTVPPIDPILPVPSAAQSVMSEKLHGGEWQPGEKGSHPAGRPGDEEKPGFLTRNAAHLKSKYYQPRPPPLVFPSAPTDKEKYSYVNMNRPFLVSFGVFAFLSLAAGMWLFLKASPMFAWYGVYALLAQFYLLTSYMISCIGKAFKLDDHKQLLVEHPLNLGTAPTIDIYLPICKEPLEIMRNTWNHIIKLKYPEGKVKVWVLDDGAQDSVEQLARRFGFEYIRRENRPHLKKAGNMRWAFARTTGDYFCVFDADFCPRPDFLLETVPHAVADPRAAIIQTPQFFRSSSDQTWTEQGAGSVQEFFYRVVETTRDTWGAAICVGSNAVYRREALAEVGGPAEIAFSEDVHTGFHALCRGWKVKYVPVVLACGVCPDTPRALFSQQMRWCFGSTTLLTNPQFYKSPLTFLQKFCYVTGFLYYSATALSVFLNPLPGPLLLWLRPDFFKYYNMFFALPSVFYGTIVFRIWARSNYTLNVQFTNVIMQYAYINSIKDRIIGQKLNWVASGDGKAHGNDKYRNMRLLAWAWTIIHNGVLIAAVIYRLLKGFPWYQVIPLLLLDAFNLYTAHRFLFFTAPKA